MSGSGSCRRRVGRYHFANRPCIDRLARISTIKLGQLHQRTECSVAELQAHIGLARRSVEVGHAVHNRKLKEPLGKRWQGVFPSLLGCYHLRLQFCRQCPIKQTEECSRSRSMWNRTRSSNSEHQDQESWQRQIVSSTKPITEPARPVQRLGASSGSM